MFSIIIIFLFQNIDLIDFIKSKNKVINTQRQDYFCPCRLLETDRYQEYCSVYTKNIYGADHIINHSIMFDEDFTQNCYYYYFKGFDFDKIELFPEVRDQCSPIFLENEANGIYWDSSVTISFDGKYVIPYCYGLEKLYIYEIKSLSFIWESEIEVKTIINIKDKVEAVRFFKDYLIVLDKKKINAYSMKKGKEFRKIGEFPLEHRLYTPDARYPEEKVPTLMRSMEMDGEYLYILNPPGNNLGPLLTFKINDEKIELINDGSEFKATFHDNEYIWRNNLILNEAHNKKYILFHESACANIYKYRWPLLRIENHIPIPIDKYFWEGEGDIENCLNAELAYRTFKNEFSYGFLPWGEICTNVNRYFTEDEEFVTPIVGEQVYDYPIWKYGMYQGPDTELLNFDGRSVSCSTDDLPTIEYLIKPEEASQNFLVMGRTYDSEGIRRVYVGYPWDEVFFRANIFQQEDGSVLFMAVLPPPNDINHPWCLYNEKGFVYMAIAEDWDGDSNNSPDVPYERDWVCVKFKEEKDPLPFGEVEICPFEYSKNIYINGWALDNNGIEGGWLFSEDANVLIPINYGKERQDIKDKYPFYPDNLHSGFEVSYDLSNQEEEEYEFYIRIMAKDYQAIDFGPYKITITKHKRPF